MLKTSWLQSKIDILKILERQDVSLSWYINIDPLLNQPKHSWLFLKWYRFLLSSHVFHQSKRKWQRPLRHAVWVVLSVNWDLVSKIRLMTHWNQEDTLLETSEDLVQPMPVQAHVLCPDSAQACRAWDLLSKLWLPESSQPMEGNGTGMPGSQLQNSSQIWNSWVSVLNTEAFAARNSINFILYPSVSWGNFFAWLTFQLTLQPLPSPAGPPSDRCLKEQGGSMSIKCAHWFVLVCSITAFSRSRFTVCLV